MARTIPSGMTALINAQGQQPTVSLTIQDWVNRFVLLATGGAGNQTAALLTSAGTILRAAVDIRTTNAGVYITRVTSPQTPSQWSSQATISSDANGLAGVELAQSGSTIRCFYQRSSDQQICYRDSSNDGLTWGGEQTTHLPPLGVGNFCYGIAAASITDVRAMYGAYNTVQVADPMYRATYSSSWSAWNFEGALTPPLGSVRGFVAVPGGAGTNFVVGAQLRANLSGIGIGSFSYAGSYSGVSSILPMDNPDIGLSYSYPGLSQFGGTYYLTAMITDDGTLSTHAGTRTTIYTSSDFVSWTAWQSLGGVFNYGAQCVVVGGFAYVFDAISVYYAPTGPGITDLSDDLLKLEIKEDLSAPATASFTISNASGQYNNHPSVRADARVQVTLGYGSLSVLTHTLLVEAITYQGTDQEQNLILTCRDFAKFLDYEQSLFLNYAGQTVAFMVGEILNRAGLSHTALPTTSQFSFTIPCFQIAPGESWLTAFDRLSRLYGFIWFADEFSKITIKEPNAADLSTWSYGAEMVAISSASSADQPNVVRVIGADATGKTVFGWAIDGPNILTVGKERYQHLVDRLLDSGAKCATRAGLAIHEAQMGAYDAELLVAMNPQLQANDVVAFTDTALGISNQIGRIIQLRLSIDPNAGQWDHHLRLSAV